MTAPMAVMLVKLQAMLPAALRIAGLVALAPGLSFQHAPAQVRVFLALGLATVLAPIASRGTQAPAEPLAFMGLCLAELLFGMVLGFAVGSLLEALRFGGEVLDLQIGLRAGQLYDPTSGSHSGILSTAYYMIALILFMAADGHHWLLRGLASSFAIVPVGGVSAGADLIALVGELGTSVLVLGLRVAAPVMATLLLADLAFGLVARAVPQINVFLVGIPAKIALGFMVAAAAASLLLANLHAITRLMAEYLEAMLRAFAG